MRAYSSMPCGEFIDEMRDAAIKANAAPAIIDMIDSLSNVDTLELQLEEANGKLTDMEESRDNIRDSFVELLAALPAPAKDDRKLRQAIQTALEDLQREGLDETRVKELRADFNL